MFHRSPPDAAEWENASTASSTAAATSVAIGRSGHRRPISTACFAPSLQLHLQPNGDVAACCRREPYGNVAFASLRDLWVSAQRSELARALAAGRFPGGCAGCGGEADLYGADDAYPAQFDHWAARLGVDGGSEPVWPRRIEFNLSNSCNLQCLQCDGELSSAIRTHREHRPPLPKVYDDRFFDDLVEFLPHVGDVCFAGGEPFLARESLRAIDLVAFHAPQASCTIITNGTQWNARVEAILERLSAHIVVSLDGMTAATYEAIRIGADHAAVMRNLSRFLEYTRERGTGLDINYCVMPQNVHELPDMLTFAEHLDITVNVIMVLGPVESTLAQLTRPQLELLHRPLQQVDQRLDATLVRNRSAWRSVMDRIESLLGEEPDGSVGERTTWTAHIPQILQFARQGEPHDARDAVAIERELVDFADDAAIHTVVIGVDERTGIWPAAVISALGIAPSAVEGRPISALLPHVERYERLPGPSQAADRFDARFEAGSSELRLIMSPRRDATGWCDTVLAHFAIRGRAPVGS